MYIHQTETHAELIAPETVNGYTRSNLIKGIRLDLASRITDGLGSDIWPITWADDDHQYSAFGDGAGFEAIDYKEQYGPHRVSLGVSRIEGEPTNYKGVNVWGGKNHEYPAQFSGKGTGIICVNKTLYMFWAGPESFTVPETRIAVSHDHSKTWALSDWKWTHHDHLFAGTFINFGKNNAGAKDNFVYALFTHLPEVPKENRNWQYEVPGQVDLARVSSDRVFDQNAYEWFCGLDANGKSTWSSNITDRQPTFEDPSGIKIVSCSYHHKLERYLLSYSFRDTNGNFGLFESPNPWGPWQVVSYVQDFDTFKPPEPCSRVCTFHFAPKWWRNAGKTFTMVFNVADDSWNTIHGDLITNA